MGAIFADDSSTNPQNISNRSYEASMDRFHETRGMGAALATGCRIRANLVMDLQWYLWSTKGMTLISAYVSGLEMSTDHVFVFSAS